MTVTYTLNGKHEDQLFTDPKEAGAAYFHADRTHRPGVVQGLEGNSARIMAATEIHDKYANGEQRFVKTLPRGDREGDLEFRTGYFEALEKSVNERLKSTDWEKTKPDHPDKTPNLDNKLYDDLETLSRVDFDKAAKAWEEHSPTGTTGPTFVDREWKRQTEEALKKEAHEVGDLDRGKSDDDTEKNVVEHVPERNLEYIDVAEMTERLERKRAREREEFAAEQERLGFKAEGKRIDVENLSEKALEQDDTNDTAERTGGTTDRPDQQFTEREKNRQIELMEQVHSQFRVAGAKFHFKDQPGKLAFKDKGERMVSASNDDRVAKAMATMADAKGWKTIKVSGHPDFQREVWMEASLRGLEVRGFKPNEQDLRALEEKRERAMKNTVEREPDRERQHKAKPEPAERERKAVENHRQQPQESSNDASKSGSAGEKIATLRAYSGRVLAHGEAPYNHDPKEKTSYYVKLNTDKGEQTVWGVDLKRAMAESKAKEGDEVKLGFQGKRPVTVTALERDDKGNVIGSKEIDTNRNTWEVQKSEKHRIVEAVAAEVLKEKVKDPAQREAILHAISQRLDERAKAGKVPSVTIYDKEAPMQSKQPERTGPQVERNAERTR